MYVLGGETGGQVECVKLLVLSGADPNRRHSVSAESALISAVQKLRLRLARKQLRIRLIRSLLVFNHQLWPLTRLRLGPSLMRVPLIPTLQD